MIVRDLIQELKGYVQSVPVEVQDIIDPHGPYCRIWGITHKVVGTDNVAIFYAVRRDVEDVLEISVAEVREGLSQLYNSCFVVIEYGHLPDVLVHVRDICLVRNDIVISPFPDED